MTERTLKSYRESAKLAKIRMISVPGRESIAFIDHEPGDGTLYSYSLFFRTPDEVWVIPRKSTFRMPKKLFVYKIIDLRTFEDVVKTAEIEDCNPLTLMEVITMILYIKEDYFD